MASLSVAISGWARWTPVAWVQGQPGDDWCDVAVANRGEWLSLVGFFTALFPEVYRG